MSYWRLVGSYPRAAGTSLMSGVTWQRRLLRKQKRHSCGNSMGKPGRKGAKSTGKEFRVSLFFSPRLLVSPARSTAGYEPPGARPVLQHIGRNNLPPEMFPCRGKKLFWFMKYLMKLLQKAANLTVYDPSTLFDRIRQVLFFSWWF